MTNIDAKQADPKPYLEPYVEAQGQYGSDFEVTLWANTKTQRLRFKVFTEMLFFKGKRVLDAGCSRGDFATYLDEKDLGYERFIGVDGLPEVIEFAQGRGLREAEFHAGDFVADTSLLKIGDPQIIAFSGTLNTMEDEMAIELLTKAWEASSEALIFNFLCDTVEKGTPPPGAPARRLSTFRLLRWAMDLTPRVQMRQDYFSYGHDATILMQRK